MATMTGDRYFAQALDAYGVSHVFFVPTIMMPAMAEMEELGIVRVVTHGEKAAAYMADGYARAAHRPGVCLAQNIGSSNLAAGLRDARMACSPVIAITGGPAPESRYRNAYQEIEDIDAFDSVTKLNVEIGSVTRLPDLLRQAFREATTGAPGPVHLRMQGSHGQVLEHDSDLEVHIEQRFAASPPFRPEADRESLRQAAQALAEAQRPVIVAGGGVAASDAAFEVLAIAEKLAIPVATSLSGKGTIPEDHPLSVGVVGTYSRWCANQVVAQADLVFFIGSRTGSQVTNNWRVPPVGTPTIQLNIDAIEIGRNYPNPVGLLGDARGTLTRLAELADGGEPHVEWAKAARELVAGWRAEAEPLRTSTALPIRPERICKEITDLLPANGVLVADTGHSGIWTGTMVDLLHPAQRYIRSAGSLGWAFPASLGIKCALPDRPVLCFTGDGGFYYHLAELETAARYGINTVVLVNNNHSFSQEQRLVDAAYGGREQGEGRNMWVFKETNFKQVAEAMGCFGVRVEEPGQLRVALEQAFAANRPAVIDVVGDMDALYARAWG